MVVLSFLFFSLQFDCVNLTQCDIATVGFYTYSHTSWNENKSMEMYAYNYIRTNTSVVFHIYEKKRQIDGIIFRFPKIDLSLFEIEHHPIICNLARF